MMIIESMEIDEHLKQVSHPKYFRKESFIF